MPALFPHSHSRHQARNQEPQIVKFSEPTDKAGCTRPHAVHWGPVDPVQAAIWSSSASRAPEMDAKLQRRVQRYGWDKAASHYERSWQSQLEPAQSALLQLAGLKPGVEVLDVACGTGLVSLKAAAMIVPGGRVIGTDISEQMVLAAREMAASRRIANARFERMEAEQSTFGDNSIDVVLCALGLMYVPDPEKAIRDFHRMLRPRGRAVLRRMGSTYQMWVGGNFSHR